MPLFEVAIIEEPTKKEAEDGATEKLVFGPKAIMARDQQSAGIAAVLDTKNALSINKDKMKVLVRPF
jgi:hypothetical protein